MLNKILGVGFIVAAFAVEVAWVGFTFGSVVVGVLLLIFAPGILLLPFNFLFAIGVALLAGGEQDSYSRTGADQNNWDNSNYHDDYENSYNNYDNEQEYRYSGENCDQCEDPLEKYYKVLGCSPSDDLQTVKKAYRNMTKKFHPDHIQGKGLDDEFLKYASDKMKEINDAYFKIKSYRLA